MSRFVSVVGLSVYRNRKLLDLAHKLNTCPECGHYSPEGLEPMHSNMQRHGRGMGHKSADHFHAAGCHECHKKIDSGMLSREEKEAMWLRAFEATLTRYWEMGWLVVKGK